MSKIKDDKGKKVEAVSEHVNAWKRYQEGGPNREDGFNKGIDLAATVTFKGWLDGNFGSPPS